VPEYALFVPEKPLGKSWKNLICSYLVAVQINEGLFTQFFLFVGSLLKKRKKTNALTGKQCPQGQGGGRAKNSLGLTGVGDETNNATRMQSNKCPTA
jgi:hypothetical protein